MGNPQVLSVDRIVLMNALLQVLHKADQVRSYNAVSWCQESVVFSDRWHSEGEAHQDLTNNRSINKAGKASP